MIFGAPRAERRYLLVDLATRYESAADLRDGNEIRTVHTDHG